jgi:TRAP-type uncharacterized transport system fused permease subunit
MFAAEFTPEYSAALAILAGALLLFINGNLQSKREQIISRFTMAVLNSARQVSMIGAIILCASIIIGVLSITGLGIKITSLILAGSGGMLWPALLLTALACLILGMEVPTTAAYVICVSVAGPALNRMGLEPLQAHLFVFWFALLSTITPPVCGAVFIAAGMIGENWLKVALTAMALGIGLYIIPLGMIANPDMLRLIEAPFAALIATFRVAIGLTLISYGLISARKIAPTILMVALGLMVVFSGLFI